MIDMFRKAVTGLKTARFKEDGFDLDLTYITDRIIAMSFPGSGLETIYRNAITDVAKLLRKEHGANYLVINLSGLPYDYTKFNSNVEDFSWEDHHSPPISLVFDACRRMHEYLMADPKNVIAVHCKAGKGRTGTLIVSYLLYSGRFETSEEALAYYRMKRFVEGGGVTQPSQIRSVQYFEQIFNSYVSLNKMMYPKVVNVDKIVLHGLPQVGGTFKPLIKIISVQSKTKLFKKEVEMFPIDCSKFEIPLTGKAPALVGDIMIKFCYENTFGSKKLFRYAFNTSFIKPDQENKAFIRLDLNNLDPHEIKKDKRFPLSFAVDTYFDVMTEKSDFNRPEFDQCNTAYDKDQKSWEMIYTILSKYKPPKKSDSVLLLFWTPERDDVDKILGKDVKKVREDLNEADYELIDEF